MVDPSKGMTFIEEANFGYQLERFGTANTEYRYIGIKISVNTGISPAFGVLLRKQIELRNPDKNKF